MAKHTTPSPESTRQIHERSDQLQARIRLRAYELYEQRGEDHGHDIDDWLQAELDLTQHQPEKIAA